MTVTTSRRWAPGLVIMFAGVSMWGCTQAGSGGQEVRLVAASTPYETDIPRPSGFALVEDVSEDRSTGTSRLYLRHVYVGKADKYAVRNFYREQMPLCRWVKVSEGTVRGVCSLRFEKGSESCTLEISDTGGGLKRRTQIQILVSQEQRGSGQTDSSKGIRNG